MGKDRHVHMRSAGYLPAALALLALAPALASAQTESGNRPFVGVWKLNVEKSHLRARRAGFELYRQYEDHGSGWMFHTVVNTGTHAVGFLFTAARYDGKQYPVYNGKLLGEFSSAGQKTPRTVAFTRVSAYKILWTDRTNGRVTAGGACTVSQDGRTLTITDELPAGKPKSTQVFDRQDSSPQAHAGVRDNSRQD